MTDAEKQIAASWVAAHANKWQTLRRGQWKYKFHEKTLVRYLPEVRMDEKVIPLVLEYLASKDCSETLSLYDQTVDASWTPISAWLERGNKAVGNVAAVALFHALATDVSNTGDGAYLIHDGCAYKVEFTYYWKQSSIIDVPESESGVSYSITSLSRDLETGLYTYALEKRTRVQQDVPLYLYAENMEKRVKREDHIGVKAGDEAGLEAGCDGAGTVVTRSISKNEDCTHNVSNTVETDKPVEKKVTEKSRGLRGTSETVTNINQSAPLDDTNLDVGETVRNEKTATGLWNTVKRTVAKLASALKIAEACEKTIFRHTHSETDAVGEDPGFTHTEEAGDGVVTSQSVRRTEEGWDVETNTRTDKPVAESVKTVSRRLGSLVTTTQNRSMKEKADTAGLNVGEEVRNDKTDSGVYDQTITKAEPVDQPLVGEACSKNAHVHEHTRTDIKADDPGRADAESVSDGTIHSERIQRTDAGGWQVTTETRTAIPSTDKSIARSEGQTEERTSYRNYDEGIVESAPLEDVNRTVSAGEQTNEFGLKDGNVDVTDYHPMQRTVQNETRFLKQTTTVKENEASEQEPVRTFETGRIFQVSSNPNGHGSASVRIVENVPKPWIWSTVWTNINRSSGRIVTTRHKIVLFRNLEEPPDLEGAWESVSPSFNMNDYGLWDGQIHYSELVSDVKDENVSGGLQYDDHSQLTLKVDKTVVKEDGKSWEKYKTLTCQKRILVSTQMNMLQEVTQYPGKPEYGLASQITKGGYAIIYYDFKISDGWVKELIN